MEHSNCHQSTVLICHIWLSEIILWENYDHFQVLHFRSTITKMLFPWDNVEILKMTPFQLLQVQLENKIAGPKLPTLKKFRFSPKKWLFFIGVQNGKAMHAALHSNSKVIVKISYFSSVTDTPEPTVLLSILLSTNFSAALLQMEYLTRPWTLYQCHGRVAHRQGKTSNVVIHAEHENTFNCLTWNIHWFPAQSIWQRAKRDVSNKQSSKK